MKPTLSQEESWINTIDWDTQPQGLLQLRNDTMERICRFLPTPRDLLEFALANTQCTTAAIPILWETPSLPVPKKLESFLNTVGSRKNLALYVKEISLCVRDGDCPTVFRPVLDSTLKRHQQDILLIMPRLIMHMVQKCECIEKLKIYGWKLDPMKIETIGATLRQLQSLTIIGSNDTFQRPFVIRNMVSRLRELRLDGDFHVSLEFANTLATRAHALRALEIPLCYGDKRIEKQALTRLCSGKPGELNLTELKLTYASPMQDEDVENVLSAFPNLRSFTLHGTINVTAGIISTAIVKCQNIESIELRAHSQTIVRQVQKPSNQNFPKRWVRASRLKRLLLEYMVLPEKIVEDLAQACDSLVTIGLRNCLHLTDKALIQLIECNERLQTLHIIECELITDQILKGLGVSKASKTIEDVYIEECGSISPRSVYLFCCATTRYRLKQLCFEGYRNLSASILGTFVPPNEDAQNAGWETRVKLDERAIDALASTDTQLNPDLLDIPKDCSLTGEQLILLAKELSIRTDTLTNAIEKIQVECPVGENDSESEQASTYESFGQSMENKPLSRVSSLKNHTLRPTTPALWAHANESAIQQYLPSSASMDDNDSRTVISTTSRTSRHSHRYSTAVTPEPRSETQAGLEEPDMDDDDDEPFEESPRQSTHSSLASEGRSPIPSPSVNGNMTFEDEPFSATTAGSTSMTKATTAVAATAIQHHEEWPALAKTHTENSNRKKTTTTVNGDLGGWGPSTQTAWSQKAQPGPKHSDPQPQQRQKHQEQPQQQWIPYTAERHEHEWQQETLEPYQPAFQRGNNSGASGGSGRGGHNSLIMESDGWGKANNYVPWNDPRNQGFAADLIEKQRNTQFWDGQQYRTSHDTIPVRVKNGATPSMQPPVSAPTVLTPANASLATSNLVNTSWPPLEKAVATSQQPVSSKKASENYGRSSRPREPNPLSSDEDNVEWDDDDDGIIIKTSPEFGPQKTSRIAPQQPARGNIPNYPNHPLPNHPGNPKWQGKEEWMDHKNTIVIEHPECDIHLSHLGYDEGWD
ncbi:hypothetical protein BDA99DRAFT_506025 [Phascolomyces articulosus]|uniref:RNI-like protein n=1 Tax=Phascolomyces articulosus TaxID=60185 RepID=A0AAD5PFG3_9FUNG|nr:hypothetical protein BDA99DRAFT_506025 [Phascolomyces articulosus]